MTPVPTTRSQLLRVIAATAITAAFIALPLWSLIAPGPFSWHVEQAGFVQGMIEIAVLGLAMYGCAWLQRRLAWVGLGILILFYVRRHGVDISIATAYLYIEGIYALGAIFYELGRRRSRAPPPTHRSVVTTAAAGLTAWLLLTWLHSLLGATEIISIQALAVIVLGGAILCNRTDPLYRHIARWLGSASRQSPACFAVFSATFLGFFAKAAVTIYYDSMWYGLQLGKTLVPHGSLFDPTGLVAPVYYYPKLYESLLLPLIHTQSLSTMYGLGIFAVFLSAALLPAIWRCTQSGRIDRPDTTWWPILLPLCVPVTLSIALTTKGDAFSVACFIVAVYCACKCWSERARSWALLGLTFAGFAALARLSALPYAALMTLVLVALGLRYARQRESSFEAVLRTATFVVSLVVAALVLYRGLLLAGVPFIAPHALVTLESWLGLKVQYPVGFSPAGAAGRARTPLLQGLLTYTLFPARAPIAQITWAGNTWLLAFIIAALAARKKPRTLPFALLLAIGLLGVLILFTFEFKPGWGADGNYFIIPFLCLTLAGASFLPSRSTGAVLLGIVAVAGVFIAQLTGTWHPGTRPFDLVLSRDSQQLAHYRKRTLAKAGLNGLADYIRATAPTSRSIGITPQHGQLVVPGWLLPTRFEPANEIRWGRPEALSTLAGFRTFARKTNLDFVILPRLEQVPADKRLLAQQLRMYMDSATTRHWAELAYSDPMYQAWRLQNNSGNHAHQSRRNGPADTDELPTGLISASHCTDNAATIHWDVHAAYPDVHAIDVFVEGFPDRSLFASGGPVGQSRTGPWLTPRTRFVVVAGDTGQDLARFVFTLSACQ